MKKVYSILCLMLILAQGINAQNNVGIGTNLPNSSAKLDISATDKGLLIPQVALTASNAAGPIASPATSLLVYNTATAGSVPNNVTPGYYYWDGTKWVKIMTNNNNSLDVGYIVGWSSNTAPPDYLLPLNSGTYNWVDYPDFQTFHTSYPCQFIASSNATSFTLKNINTSGRFLRGNTSAGIEQAGSTAMPSVPFTNSTNGVHTHSVDPPNTSTTNAGAHSHTLTFNNDDFNGGGGGTNGLEDDGGGATNVKTTSGVGDHSHNLDINAFNSASNGDHSHTISGGDAETRPINTSVIWCIKVKPTATSGTLSITNTANAAINGLSVYGSAIGLGGNLNQSTTINQIDNNLVYNLNGTGDFDVQDNGVSALLVKDDGNVGINNNNPTSKLHILVPADKNNNPADNGVYVYNAGNAGDNDDAIIAARVNNANAGDPFLSLDIDGVTGWSIGIDNSDADKLKFSNAWNDPGTNNRMSITTGGVVNISNLAGSGYRDVYANAAGDLVTKPSNVAYYVNRTDIYMDNANVGYRVVGASTNDLYVNNGDVVTISITTKFWWTGGSGADQEKYGMRITGACGTINDYETHSNGTSDDVPRGQEQASAHQFVWIANCDGNVQFSLLCDNNYGSCDDTSYLSDVVVIARRN
jgi:hypothetical protein